MRAPQPILTGFQLWKAPGHPRPGDGHCVDCRDPGRARGRRRHHRDLCRGGRRGAGGLDLDHDPGPPRRGSRHPAERRGEATASGRGALRRGRHRRNPADADRLETLRVPVPGRVLERRRDRLLLGRVRGRHRADVCAQRHRQHAHAGGRDPLRRGRDRPHPHRLLASGAPRCWRCGSARRRRGCARPRADPAGLRRPVRGGGHAAAHPPRSLPAVRADGSQRRVVEAMGHLRVPFLSALAAAAVNIALSFVLVPAYDAVGAAIASCDRPGHGGPSSDRVRASLREGRALAPGFPDTACACHRSGGGAAWDA